MKYGHDIPKTHETKTKDREEEKKCRSLPFLPELPILDCFDSASHPGYSALFAIAWEMGDEVMMENLIANVCEQAIKLTN